MHEVHWNTPKQEKVMNQERGRSEDIRESRELDLSFPGKRNSEVTKERKINGQTQVQLVVDVPIGADVPHQAHQYVVRHLHRHLQHCLLVPRQWPWVLHLPRRYHPASFFNFFPTLISTTEFFQKKIVNWAFT